MNDPRSDWTRSLVILCGFLAACPRDQGTDRDLTLAVLRFGLLVGIAGFLLGRGPDDD